MGGGRVPMRTTLGSSGTQRPLTSSVSIQFLDKRSDLTGGGVFLRRLTGGLPLLGPLPDPPLHHQSRVKISSSSPFLVVPTATLAQSRVLSHLARGGNAEGQQSSPDASVQYVPPRSTIKSRAKKTRDATVRNGTKHFFLNRMAYITSTPPLAWPGRPQYVDRLRSR